jgi:hypothetical protein
MQPSSRAAGRRATSSMWSCPRTFPASSPSLFPARAVPASKPGSPMTPRRQHHYFPTALSPPTQDADCTLVARGEGGQHLRALIHPRLKPHILVTWPRKQDNHPRAAHEKQTTAQDALRREERGAERRTEFFRVTSKIPSYIKKRSFCGCCLAHIV